MRQHGISGMLVLDADLKLEGIVSRRDILASQNDDVSVTEIMTPREKLVVADPGINFEKVAELIAAHRIENCRWLRLKIKWPVS